MFIRVEGGDGGNGVHANVTNHNTIWADRVSFLFGGGTYNNVLVTTPGNAASQKIEGTLPTGTPSPAVLTFYYPNVPEDSMLQLELSNIIGNRSANSLVVWAASDGYIRDFPTAVPPGRIIYGWRDFAYSEEDFENLPEPLLVRGPTTIVPISRTHAVTFVVEEGGVAMGTASVQVNSGETIPKSSIPSTAAEAGWRFMGWEPTHPADHGYVTSDLVFTATFEFRDNNNNVQHPQPPDPPPTQPTDPPSQRPPLQGNNRQTVPANDNALSVPIRLSNNNTAATLPLPSDMVNEFIYTNIDNIVNFDLTSLYDVTSVALPRAAIRSFADADLAIKFQMPQATVIFDAVALESFGKQARSSNVSLVAAKVGLDAFRVNVQSGGQQLANFDGIITISVPWFDNQPASVLLFNNDEELVLLSAESDAGVLSFNTDQLGIFTIIYAEENEDEPLADAPILHVISFAMDNNVYTIDGIAKTNDVAPFLDTEYDRVMIPLRAVSEAIGSEVTGNSHRSNFQLYRYTNIGGRHPIA